MTMRELYEVVKDKLFTFEHFCYCVNCIASENLADSIKDSEKYVNPDDDYPYFDGDGESDIVDEESIDPDSGFDNYKYEKKMRDIIKSGLQNDTI
jgi:folate-dependent tRNA-U54 methylase TrmFO/GidA